MARYASRPFELPRISPWLCTTCCELFEYRTAGMDREPQRCACRTATAEQPQPDRLIGLCHVCALEPLVVSDPKDSWFCGPCLQAVEGLNTEAGEEVVSPAGLLGPLHELREARIRDLLKSVRKDKQSRVSVAPFLAALDRDYWRTRRAHAIQTLCRHVGWRAWPSGEFTPLEVPDIDATDGEEADAEDVNEMYTRLCPLCGSTDACRHHILTYDRTFPMEYMEGEFDWGDFLPLFEALYGLLNAAVATGTIPDIDALRAHVESLEDMPKRLRTVLDELIEGAACSFEELDATCEIEWDGYVVNRVVSDYLADLCMDARQGRYLGTTSHEDNIPMASSAYESHWARDAADCAERALWLLERDLVRLGVAPGSG